MCKVNDAIQCGESGGGKMDEGFWLEKHCFMWFETLHLWFNFNVHVKNDSTRIRKQPAKTLKYATNTKYDAGANTEFFNWPGGGGAP
jgi:glycyl-tRNA synthetase (class II)